MNPVGRQAANRAEIERMFADEHGASGLFRSSTIKETVDRIRFVKPDVAVVHGTWQTTGAIGPQGAPMSPSPSGHFMLVFVKQGSQWKIATGEAMTPVPGGPPAMD